MGNRATGNKYILGWFKLRAGKREEFGALALRYAQVCREEEGCLFFELLPHHEETETYLLAEAFISEEAHSWHRDQPYFASFVNEVGALCESGHFENVIASSVECDDPVF